MTPGACKRLGTSLSGDFAISLAGAAARQISLFRDGVKAPLSTWRKPYWFPPTSPPSLYGGAEKRLVLTCVLIIHLCPLRQRWLI